MKVAYTVDSNGVHINGVTSSNPVIYDNDMVLDTSELFYLWLKANRKEVNLVGNISTKDGHPTSLSHDATFKQWTDCYNAYTSNGYKNVVAPVRGSSRVYNGTTENSVGSDLIISEAKKASPQKPLVIFVGGQVTTIANAWLKDNSIGPNIIVLHVDGYGDTDYNSIDRRSAEIVIANIPYLVWDGDMNSWYNKPGSPMYSGSNKMPGINLNGMPSNSFTNLLRNNWFNQAFAQWGDLGDGCVVYWFFNNSLWQNVVRKNMSNQTVTGDNYNFLLVSKNNWNAYGPQFNSWMVNPTSYIPVTTTPPANVAPSVQITNTQTTLSEGLVTITAVSSDPDGTISKVEFFNGTTKIGEDLASPYSITWNAVKGTHIITAKATDNQGASTTSMAVTFTINAVIPPVEPPISVGPWENYIDVRRFGATGSGNENDLPAFQAAVDAAIKVNGHLIIPSPKNFYRINDTWKIEPKESNQAYLNISSNGKYWSQLVYMGQSGKPAIQIVGEKWGRIQGLACKIGDGIIDSVCYEVGTSQASTSTSAFTLGNCSAETNTGINNNGYRIGKVDGFTGSDISQILFSNCSSWGPHRVIAGQIGFAFVGHNSLQFVILGGGSIFCDTGIKVTAGGAIAIVGYGTSQNNTELHMTHSTQVAFTGGRFESSKRFLKVEGSANFTGVRISDALISDFKPTDGRLFDFQGNGGLTLDNVKIESSVDYGSGMITLGNGVGTLSVRGGAFNASDPFLTQGGWRAKIENVVRLNKDYQAIGYFTNK